MSSRKNKPVPDGRDLIALFEAAAANAGSLLADAECLMGAGSAARAHALAVLAEEELGKAKLCVVALVRPAGAGVEPEEFWREFYDHPSKLVRELSTQGVLNGTVSSVPEFVASLPGESRSVHGRKLRGLYVDYENGVVLVPGDIGGDEARKAIDDARASLGVFEAAFKVTGVLDVLRGLTGTGLEPLLRDMVQSLSPGVDASGWDADMLYQEIVRVVEGDPDHVLRAVHEWWGAFRPPEASIDGERV